MRDLNLVVDETVPTCTSLLEHGVVRTSGVVTGAENLSGGKVTARVASEIVGGAGGSTFDEVFD